LLQATQDGKRSRWKKRAAGEDVKIGHGGTLDPLATGVLVVGVGKGTKQMHGFLGCTKTYESVILFGKSTDTYDVAGKVVASAPHSHITKALVEEKLASFRGKIKQIPPIYSALKVDGMKAYDYARTGQDLPRELAARDLEVETCEIVEWLRGGQHEYRWPLAETSNEANQLAEKMVSNVEDSTQKTERLPKRKLSDPLVEAGQERGKENVKKQKSSQLRTDREPNLPSLPMGGTLKNETLGLDVPTTSSTSVTKESTAAMKARPHTHEIGPLSSETCPAPAARIRVTSSSGFYVRSFAHDLGVACGSQALMATLFRSRQAGFDAASALTYEELAGGEAVWGPKLQNMLDSWNGEIPRQLETDGRNKSDSTKGSYSQNGSGQWPNSDPDKVDRAKRKDEQGRRNSSSGSGED
jgi:tRNA pseudouridine55 synthase